MVNHLVELYWPSKERHKGELYLWFHEKKALKDKDYQAGDRVLIYEVRHHPEEDERQDGARTIFASGTLTDEREAIPPQDHWSGGKRWVFQRRILREYSVPPELGIPLGSAKSILGYGGWPQQGFSISMQQFEA